MAERLGLEPGVKELKLGPTFTSNRGTAFHTLKYDFKPASVDVTKMATVEVGSNNTMTVTVPHLDGAGIPHTVFKGSQRPYSKECVLIIDRITGEITLEKLSSNVQLKKTRVEQKIQSSSSVTSSNNMNSIQPTSVEPKQRSPTHGRNTSRTKVTSGKKREPTVQLHPVPKQQPSPLRVSPYPSKSPPTIMNNFNNNCSPRQSTNLGSSSLASLPMISADFDEHLSLSAAPIMPTSVSTPSIINHSMNLPTLSTITNKTKNKIGDLSDSSSSSSSSDSSDSDSEREHISNSIAINGNLNANNIQSSSLTNMPDNLLNDDLQLSESESDSD